MGNNNKECSAQNSHIDRLVQDDSNTTALPQTCTKPSICPLTCNSFARSPRYSNMWPDISSKIQLMPLYKSINLYDIESFHSHGFCNTISSSCIVTADIRDSIHNHQIVLIFQQCLPIFCIKFNSFLNEKHNYSQIISSMDWNTQHWSW